MKNIIIQTSDGVESSSHMHMLDMTGPIVKKYADIFGYDYYRWDGIKVKPNGERWLAIYNKAFLFDEMYREGVYDWIILLDCDSFISTHKIDFLKNTLEAASGKLIVSTMVDIEQGWWCVDGNTIFINTKHENSQLLIENWLDRTLRMYDWNDPLFGLTGPGDNVAHYTVGLDNEMVPFHNVLAEFGLNIFPIHYMDRVAGYNEDGNEISLIFDDYIYHYGRYNETYLIEERIEQMKRRIDIFKEKGDLII